MQDMLRTRFTELVGCTERRPDGFTLWTHQPNAPARAFYEREGLVAVEFTDGSANEEQVPDVRYAWWSRGREAHAR